MTDTPPPEPTVKRKKSALMQWLVVLLIIVLLAAGFSFYRAKMRVVPAATTPVQSAQAASAKQLSALAQQLQSVRDSSAQKRADLQRELASIKSQLNNQFQSMATIQQSVERLSPTGNANAPLTLNEVMYLLRLANLALIIDYDVGRAQSLMGLADRRLTDLNDPSFDQLRQTIISDKQKLKFAPKVDVVRLLSQLNTLQGVVNRAAAVRPQMPQQKANPALSSHTTWKDKLLRTAKHLKGLVIFHDNRRPITPQLGTQQFLILKQNIIIALQQAQWALLHHNNKLYQQGLKQAQQWVAAFPTTQSGFTAPLQKSLAQLAAINITPSLPNLEDALQQVHQLLMQNEAVKSAAPLPSKVAPKPTDSKSAAPTHAPKNSSQPPSKRGDSTSKPKSALGVEV